MYVFVVDWWYVGLNRYGLPFVSPDNILVSTINGTGAAIETIYVLIFLIFSPKKEKGKIALLLSIIICVFGAVVLISLFALHGHTRKLFCGLLATIFSILMYASPLTILVSLFFLFLCYSITSLSLNGVLNSGSIN